MFQPELIRLLTESGHLDKTLIEGIPTFDSLSRELRQSGVCSTGDNKPTPFSFTPQRIQLNKDHELFEDGDILRHLYLQDLSATETDDKPKLSVSEFGCHISGCSQVFSSVEEYEHHYNSLHRHVCCSCRRLLPSARLLDIHIQEWHDSLFTVLAQRQDMYQCLVEGCELKFRTSQQRKDHLIRIHKYPPDFRFDKAKKGKKTRDIKSHHHKDTSMEVTEDVCESEGVCEVVCESEGVCEVVCDAASDQPEEGEAMELHLSQEPGTVEEPEPAPTTANSASVKMHTEYPAAASHSTTHTSTEQSKPRYSYRVPATVCFGQGSVRGFRGRGRRK